MAARVDNHCAEEQDRQGRGRDRHRPDLGGVAHAQRAGARRGDGSGGTVGEVVEGNLEKTWDANHPSSGQTATPSQTYAYDELDRLETVSQPFPPSSTAVTTYEYDVQDHLTAVVDAEGNRTEYVYSDRDLLTAEISPVSGT